MDATSKPPQEAGRVPERVPDGPLTGDAAGGSDHIFDGRFRQFMDTFGKACDDGGATTAVAIVIDPQTAKPHIFMRGDEYHVAALLAKVLRGLQHKIMTNIRA